MRDGRQGGAPGGARQRADRLAVLQGIAPSRTRAAEEIRAGTIWADGRRLIKPSELLAPDAVLERRGAAVPYVSRGGVKLARGLDTFGFDPSGLVALDIGASTGGFTDVLLRRGAGRVYAVDVGHGQLHPSLGGDPRVVVREGVNARDLSVEHVPEPVGAIVCDVSFIGLHLVLPAAFALTAPGAWLVALVKPQFEGGPEHVGKGGIVKDPSVHRAVCRTVAEFVAAQGWRLVGFVESPIKGSDGNTEFLIGARNAQGEA